jgi:hypothetical protein
MALKYYGNGSTTIEPDMFTFYSHFQYENHALALTVLSGI